MKKFLMVLLLTPLMACATTVLDKAQADSTMFLLLSSDMSQDEFNIPQPQKINRNNHKRGSVFIVEGSNFQINSLRDDVYYITGKNNAFPVNDRRYPMETMNNLLLGKIPGGNRDITVHHHQYGGHNATLLMPFDELRTKLEQGKKVYCSITAVTPEKLEGIVVYHDVKLNLIHMLQVTSPISTITTGIGEMNAELYTNIPQANISNLFRTEDELNSPEINPLKKK